jgi:hypothetical protein
MRKILTALAATLLAACSVTTTTASGGASNATSKPVVMNDAAERYVKLVLAMGEHDADYVDSYYGPPEWRTEVQKAKPSLEQIHTDAVALDKELRAMSKPLDTMLALRHEYLARQTEALIARAEILRGKKMTFDEESKALYDAVAPHYDEAYFERLTSALDAELPGTGALADRLDAFRKAFIIPKDRLGAVFRSAIEGCRSRTLQHITLPPDESFVVEYVTNKSWSGYNWYKGGDHSVIQVNTDLPIYIDRAIDLACHEGYPGHHVYNSLLEKNLVRDRGWQELTVYALFSPQSLIAEGSANYGIDVAFPANQRVEFEKNTLFPLAELDPRSAPKYYRIQELTSKLSYAGNEAARGYLDGKLTADQAVNWLTKYALMSEPRARQRLKFIEQYRSYVINYNLGKDLVRDYVERRANGDENKRWQVFSELLSSPRLPSALR